MRPALLTGCTLAASIIAGPAFAELAECNGFAWSVAREQTAFSGANLPNVSNGSPLPGIGQAAVVALAKQDTVSFPIAPTRKPKHDAPYAGTFSLPPLAAAGVYQVTVSGDAWLEVAQDGKLLRQAGFTGSHTCPIVRKSVRFDLAPGPATLEISDAGNETVKVEIVPVE